VKIFACFSIIYITVLLLFGAFTLNVIISHFTYSMAQDILCKADSHSVCQTTACCLYGTRRFITVLTQRPATGPYSKPAEPSSHVLFPLLRSCQRISPGSRRFETFHDITFFNGEGLLAPRPTPKLEDHPLSAASDCLLKIFSALLHIWRPSPPSAT
jgi:hypothetical protein